MRNCSSYLLRDFEKRSRKHQGENFARARYQSPPMQGDTAMQLFPRDLLCLSSSSRPIRGGGALSPPHAGFLLFQATKNEPRSKLLPSKSYGVPCGLSREKPSEIGGTSHELCKPTPLGWRGRIRSHHRMTNLEKIRRASPQILWVTDVCGSSPPPQKAGAQQPRGWGNHQFTTSALLFEPWSSEVVGYVLCTSGGRGAMVDVRSFIYFHPFQFWRWPRGDMLLCLPWLTQ